MASFMGIEVYKNATSRLHGYGSVLLVVKSPAWMHLMSSSGCFLDVTGRRPSALV